MNDRGLSLTPTDVLEGYILANIGDPECRNAANQIWRKQVTGCCVPWGSGGALGGAAASKCCQNPICFSSVQRRKVEAEFSDGALTNNRGIWLPDVGTLVIAPH